MAATKPKEYAEEKISIPPMSPESPDGLVHRTETVSQTSEYGHDGRVLIVAVDISQRSRDSFAWAIANMYCVGDMVLLINVTERFPGSGIATALAVYEAHENERKAGLKLLLDFANFCASHKITYRAKQCVGDAAQVIKGIAERVTPQNSLSLIVGNHSKSALERILIGSTSESILHQVHVPVVVVKRSHVFSTDRDINRRIGVCVDSSGPSRAAFDWVMRELYRDCDTVFILHMASAKRSQSDETLEDGAVCGIEFIDHYSRLCASRSVDYHTVYARTHMAVAGAMTRLVASLSLDCVVVGSRGRGAVKRTLFGSFSDSIVRTCPCNIVVVK